MLRNRQWVWMHPAETVLSDVDCTDMTDIQFERLVRKITGLGSSGDARTRDNPAVLGDCKGGIESITRPPSN